MREVESSDADAYYARLREQAAAKAAVPSPEEVAEGIMDGRPEPVVKLIGRNQPLDVRHDDGDSRL